MSIHVKVSNKQGPAQNDHLHLHREAACWTGEETTLEHVVVAGGVDEVGARRDVRSNPGCVQVLHANLRRIMASLFVTRDLGRDNGRHIQCLNEQHICIWSVILTQL